ncbi:MarR family winged helix-turn-helix transcriptional regulator [Pseudooceanicola algae]|uniref:Uncharacterized protein n=1 Tax=Pseudooceanicola algae TaxID=1537215 RepID=A0A418SKZ2_9RHOB|nr:MarR family transcriptional regulator [Pseudooceanicola algae]QPM90921.1 hypothetical protein PSAL_021630 [Pseudooceanicola algae]
MIDHSDELEEFTPYLMNRIIARYNKGVEAALKDAGVSVAQMRALAVLAESGTCTITELSVMTVIKQSTLSRTLDTMKRAGLIQRQAQDGDSRFRLISLTDAGRAAYDAGWPAMGRMKDTMLKALTPAEQDEFNRMLLKILVDIRHHDF